MFISCCDVNQSDVTWLTFAEAGRCFSLLTQNQNRGDDFVLNLKKKSEIISHIALILSGRLTGYLTVFVRRLWSS